MFVGGPGAVGSRHMGVRRAGRGLSAVFGEVLVLSDGLVDLGLDVCVSPHPEEAHVLGDGVVSKELSLLF
jgi:hypothetical protein